MRILTVDSSLLSRVPGAHGAFTRIAKSEGLAVMLEGIYGRAGLCLKLFRGEPRGLGEFRWDNISPRSAQSPLLSECTKIQNLFWLDGLAPRVYDVVTVNGHVAQVTDFAEAEGELDRAAVRAAKARHKVRIRWDTNPKNSVGKRFVDFQQCSFHPPGAYERELVKQAYKSAAWGSRKEPYQSVEGLLEESQRDTESRLQAMRWWEVEFSGATVLDVGCNLGAFCRAASASGARRVVGVDVPVVARLAFEVSNWLGYWNLDFVGARLPGQAGRIMAETGIGRFDVVLVLSAKQTKPVPWAFELCKQLCYFEGHVPDKERTYRETLERHFRRVEFLGTTRDHGPRPLFRCWR